MKANLLSEFCLHIERGVVSVATVIWNRHEAELLSNINDECLVTILDSVPESVSSGDIGMWLQAVILPCILCHYSSIIDQFTSWVITRIMGLELTEKSNWPSNALSLLDIVLYGITSNRMWEEQLGIQANQTISQLKTALSPCITKLMDLRDKLNNLSYVKDQLGLDLPLSEYYSETHESVVFKLLDRAVATETILSMIQYKIGPYVEHFSLSLDEVLVHYIKHMIVRIPELTPDSPWEAKGVMVVRSIKDRKLYVEGCIELLHGVRTYWSALVEGLVQDCLQVDHYCIEELKKEYKLLKIKQKLFEYGITNFNYSSSNTSIAWNYIQFIMKQESETILEDTLKIAELYSLSKTKVYMLYFTSLGKKNEVWRIADTLEGIEDSEEAIFIATRTLTYTNAKLDETFNKKIGDVELWKADMLVAIECLKHLKHLGVKAISDGELVDELLAISQRLLHLQSQFNIILTRYTLRDPTVCDSLLESSQVETISAIRSNGDGLLDMEWKRYLKLGSLLGYSKPCLCIKLAVVLVQQDHLNEAKHVISLVNPDFLIEMELKQYVEGLVAVVMEIWRTLVPEEEKGKADIERWVIDWIVSLSAEIVYRCSEEALLYSTELHSLCCLLKWVWSCCIGDFDADERFSSLLDMHRYREDGLLLELSQVFPLALNYCQKQLSNTAAGTCFGPCDSHVTSLSRVVEPAGSEGKELHVHVELAETQHLIEMFEESSHHQIAFSLGIQSLMHYEFVSSLNKQPHSQTSVPASVINLDMLHDLRSTLTTKVLTARRLDHWYGLALLLLAPVEISEEKITECKGAVISSYTKVKEFCNLTSDYGALTGRLDTVQKAQHYYKTADWGKRLRDYQISFTKAFRGSQLEKKAVLFKMFQVPSISLESVIEYCNHIGCNSDETYLQYIRVVLTAWEDHYEDRLNNIIPLVSNKEKIALLLYQMLTKHVSPYDYQRIEVLLNHLVLSKASYVPQGLKLLQCLKRHTRTGPLSDIEKNWIKKWKTVAKDCVLHLDKDSVCLPFHPLLVEESSSVAVTILSMEITRDSLSKLLPICSILQISADTVLEEAITNIVKTSPPATIKYSDLELLVISIRNNTKAINIAKWAAAELGKSNMEESITALKGAVGIAAKWKENCTAQETQRIETCYKECCVLVRLAQVKQILLEYDLHNREELTALVSQPDQLIKVLYHDLTTTRPQVIPVHEIAARIGAVCDINVTGIRTALAEEWLPYSNIATRDMNITQFSMMEDPTSLDRGLDDEETEEEISLRRLAYLLNIPIEVKQITHQLFNWAQTPKIVGGARSRIRAIQVMFAIAPISVIESVSGITVQDISELTQIILFVCELEDIRMKMSIDGFKRCKKEGLIWTLWRNHSHEPRAVRLVCELCLYYNMHDPLLWGKLLEQLLELHMIQYLRYVLKSLSQLPILLEIPGIKELWYNVVITPVKEVSSPPTSYQLQECSKSLKLLQRCPFIFDIDVSSLVKLFEAVGISSMLPEYTKVMSLIN